MNFKQFYIFESPIIDDRYGRTAKSQFYNKPEIGSFFTDYKNSKLIKKIGNIEIRKVKPEENHLYYVIDETPVAVLVYKFLDKKVAGFQKYPMVGWIYTDEKNNKKGIQKELHDFLMSYFGGILVDVTLSKAGFDFYKKFANNYFTYSFDNYDLKSAIKEVDWNDIKQNKNERFVILDHKLPKEVLG